MPIVVECPSCGQKLKVPENLEGKKVRCSKCQGTFTAEPPAPPPPPPADERELADDLPPDDDYEDRPKRRSKRRRDDDDRYGGPVRPARGGMILTFGIVSIALAVLNFPCSFLTGLIPFVGIASPVVTGLFLIGGFVFGILGWVMGSGDLKKIKAGIVDRSGQGATKGGFICGIVGTVLNSLILLCGCIGLIAFFIFGAAALGLASTAASMQTFKAGNPAPANNPAPRRSFGLPPAKLADYMPRIEGRSK
jgi:hypothetical protein